MADLYAAANQDSGVSSYISAASPVPSTGFGHGLGVSRDTHKNEKLFQVQFISSICDMMFQTSVRLFLSFKGPLIATAFTNGYH